MLLCFLGSRSVLGLGVGMGSDELLIGLISNLPAGADLDALTRRPLAHVTVSIALQPGILLILFLRALAACLASLAFSMYGARLPGCLAAEVRIPQGFKIRVAAVVWWFVPIRV